MYNHRQPQKTFNFRRAASKLFLSAFVVISFVLYALNKPFASADSTANVGSPAPGVTQFQQELAPTAPVTSDAQTSASDPTAVPTQAPTDVLTAVPQQAFLPTPLPPTATAQPSASGYKDGTYNGPVVDAFYGQVQVQAVIQNGKIKSVQFLQYPSDRRTSVRINSVAVPDLQQEAIQAQNANVNIVTGATLTSEAFIMSLQSALANSHS